jgi:hypothetical protein
LARVSTLIRIGILCSWLGTGIAMMLIGAAICLLIDFRGSGEDNLLARLMLLVAPAIVALVLGWGARYLATMPRW